MANQPLEYQTKLREMEAIAARYGKNSIEYRRAQQANRRQKSDVSNTVILTQYGYTGDVGQG